MQTLSEKIEDTQKNIKRGSRVRFVLDGQTRHEGTVIDLTSTFAKIYRPRNRKDDGSADVSPESAEWFPIDCKSGGIMLVS